MAEKSLRPILLVEDEETDAALIARAFEKANVQLPIVRLENGDEALGYLAGAGKYADRAKYPLPILMLLDLNLPGMNGFQLLQWKRAQPDVRRIPVVVLTSDEEPETINSAYDLGANSYLVKPGSVTGIVRMLKAIQSYWVEQNEPPPLMIGASN